MWRMGWMNKPARATPLKGDQPMSPENLATLSDAELLKYIHGVFADEAIPHSDFGRIFDEIFQARKAIISPETDLLLLSDLAMLGFIGERWQDLEPFLTEFAARQEYGAVCLVCTDALRHLQGAEAQPFLVALQESADQGYYRSKFSIFDHRVKRLGVLALPLRVMFRLFWAPAILIAVVRDQNDPRVLLSPAAARQFYSKFPYLLPKSDDDQ